MQIVLREDPMSYFIEQYSDESVDQPTFWVSPAGTQKLWDAGWRPYTQPRCSKYLFGLLVGSGDVRRWLWPPPLCCSACGSPQASIGGVNAT